MNELCRPTESTSVIAPQFIKGRQAMNHCTEAQSPAGRTRPGSVRQRLPMQALRAAPLVSASGQVAGNSNKVRQLTNLHRSVMQTLEHAKPTTELFVRLEFFAKSVLLAAELAEIVKLPQLKSSVDISVATAEMSSLQDIAELAHAALAAGKELQGLAVLSGMGFLLGGAPRAALERALGLLRIKRNSQACSELVKALDGMGDQDGMATALLAQLWFEARDPRWIPLAKRVLASGLNFQARARCTELLAGDGKAIRN